MKTNVKMNCPQCNSAIDVDELLVQQFEQSIKKDLEAELQRKEEQLNLKKKEFINTQSALAKERLEFDELVNASVHIQLLSREEVLKDAIRKEVAEEKALQLQVLEEELIKKSTQLKEMNQSKAQITILRRDLEEAETRITLEKEKELTERLEQARSTIKEQEQQASFLKLREREKVIDDLKKKLDEAKLKADQSSSQLRGEVMEQSMETILRTMHPTDEIIEIKKGQLGADCIQKVMVNGHIIGSIIYEMKDTQSFSAGWTTKLKNDNRTAKADLMVIVTKTMPKEITGKFGILDGVWICQYSSITDLVLALRFGLLKVQAVAITQQNKESKMGLLYKYLTSEEFKNVFEAILSGFKTLQDSHHQEKQKLQNLWKQREKALEQVLSNTVEFYGSIKGISSSIPEVKMLDFSKTAS